MENHHLGLRRHQRYLSLDDFCALCGAVGIYGCNAGELEEYERERWMFPVARTVMPDVYAHSFWVGSSAEVGNLDFDKSVEAYQKLDYELRYPTPIWRGQNYDLRHLIDKSFDKVDGLLRPCEHPFSPWDSYAIEISQRGVKYLQPIASHFYHHWQVFELFLVRRLQKGMYRDNAPVRFPKTLTALRNSDLLDFFETVSKFQHVYYAREQQLIFQHEPDEDSWVYLDPAEQHEFEFTVRQYAAELTQESESLTTEIALTALREMMNLHFSLEAAEKYKLANFLRVEIWYAVQFIEYAFRLSSEETAQRAGCVGGFVEPYLILLFPNRRHQTRRKARKILLSLLKEYNRCAPGYGVSESGIDRMLDYIEETDLALFEFILAELNRNHFEIHSWQAAEAFLHLKSLASFPESLLRYTLISHKKNKATTLGDSINSFLPSRYPAIKQHYQPRSANNTEAFSNSVNNFVLRFEKGIANLSPEEYLGINLSLTFLVRNFTSHHLVDVPSLLRGQYNRCVRSIIVTVFFIWSIFDNQS